MFKDRINKFSIRKTKLAVGSVLIASTTILSSLGSIMTSSYALSILEGYDSEFHTVLKKENLNDDKDGWDINFKFITTANEEVPKEVLGYLPKPTFQKFKEIEIPYSIPISHFFDTSYIFPAVKIETADKIITYYWDGWRENALYLNKQFKAKPIVGVWNKVETPKSLQGTSKVVVEYAHYSAEKGIALPKEIKEAYNNTQTLIFAKSATKREIEIPQELRSFDKKTITTSDGKTETWKFKKWDKLSHSIRTDWDSTIHFEGYWERETTETNRKQDTPIITLPENQDKARKPYTVSDVIVDDPTRLKGEPDIVLEDGSEGIKEVLQITNSTNQAAIETIITPAKPKRISRATGEPTVENLDVPKDIRFETETQYSDDLYEDETKTLEKGVLGKEITHFKVYKFNNRELRREELPNKTIVPAKKEVILKGRKPITTKEIEKENVVENFKTIEVKDVNLPENSAPIIKEGKNGVSEVSYEVTYYRGLETGRRQIGSKVITPAEDKVITIPSGKLESKEEIVTKEISPVKEVIQKNPNLDKSHRKVLQEGTPEVLKETLDIKLFKGKEISRTTKNSIRIPGTPRIIEVGSKEVSHNRYTNKETILFREIIENDSNRLEGSPDIIKQEGRNGSKETTYVDEIVNGVKSKTTAEPNPVIVNPINKIISRATGKAETKQEEKVTNLQLETVRTEDKNLLVGQERIENNGTQGKLIEIFEVKTFKGQEISRRKVSERRENGTPRRVVYGTKKPDVIRYENENVIENISFTTTYKDDFSRLEGEPNIVVREGSNGSKTITYRNKLVNGVKTSSEKLSEVITKNAINKEISIAKGKATVTRENNTIVKPLETIRTADSNLLEGTENVIDNGAQERKIETYEIKTFNGRQLSKTKVSERIETAGRPKKVVYGTKKPDVIVKRQEKERQNIKFETIVEKDSKALKNTKTVKTKGVDGVKEITKEITYVNNKPTETKIISENIISQPVNEVIVEGTAEQITRRIKVPKTEDLWQSELNVAYDTEKVDYLKPGEVKVVKEGSVQKTIYTKYQVLDYLGNFIIDRLVDIERIPAVRGLIHIGKSVTNVTTFFGEIPKLFHGFEITDMFHKVIDTFDNLDKLSPEEKYRRSKDDNLKTLYYANKNGEKHAVRPLLNEELIKDINNFKYIDIVEFNKEFNKLLNEERRSKGLNPVEYSPRLQSGANQRSIEQIGVGHIRTNGQKHTRPDMSSWRTAFEYLPYDTGYLGENILGNHYDGNPYELVSEKYLAELTFNQWKNSKGHYDNMMHPLFKYSTVGFAMGNNNVHGDHVTTIIATQILSAHPNQP